MYLQVTTPLVVPLDASQTDQSVHRVPQVLGDLPSLQTLIKVWAMHDCCCEVCSLSSPLKKVEQDYIQILDIFIFQIEVHKNVR